MGKKEDAIAAVQAAAGVFADQVGDIVRDIIEKGRALTSSYKRLGDELYDMSIERGDFAFSRKVLRASVESVLKAEGLDVGKGTDGGKMLDQITRMATYYAQVRAGMINDKGRPENQPNEDAAKAGFKASEPRTATNGDGTQNQPENIDPMTRPLVENIGQATSWLTVALLQVGTVTDVESLTADDVIHLTNLTTQVLRFVEWQRKNPIGKAVAVKIKARLDFEREQATEQAA